MTVSDLTVVPPAANWRMNFTANAPVSKLSATGDYTFGLSDRGDQFFVKANTDTNPAGDFTYGTAVRNSDGTLTYTSQEATLTVARSTAGIIPSPSRWQLVSSIRS